MARFVVKTFVVKTFVRHLNIAIAVALIAYSTLFVHQSANAQTPTKTPTPGNSSIGDRVWNDTNHNGLQDSGEAGVPNVIVTLLKDCGGAFALNTATTNANGSYAFTNPPFGQYRVRMSLPTGFTFSPQNQGADDALDSDVNIATGISDCMTLATGQNAPTWDAGIYPAAAPTPTLTPTKTPVPPTMTATATKTPAPPTATATATKTPVPPTATSTPTNTPVPPTATLTHTPAPPPVTLTPTNTPVPPTVTSTSTSTSVPLTMTATATNTLAPPTATFTSTNTSVPPTATFTPTNTPVPPTATFTPTNTLVPPTATATLTNTPVPPTATFTPTKTPVPPTATFTPTNTPVSPTATAVLTPTARALGQATVLSGPNICSGQACYNLAVNCGQVSQPINVSLKVGAPTGGASEQGTIMFFTGWIGDYYWAYDGAVQMARAANSNAVASPDTIRRTLDNNSIIIDNLRAAGFRTVQVEWNSGWFIAQQGQTNEDLAKLACRPATIARWVYDNLRNNGGEAFCATGHSNGGSELAYMMTQYHMADLFSLVVFEGGPNWARVDKSCVLDPAHPELYGDAGERNTIDWGFGYANDGSGICAQGNVAQLSRFQNASLAFNAWFYVYPHTQVAFLIGANDPTTTAKHGAYFYNWLVNAGTPLITYETVPGADHFTTEVQAGADMMRNKLLNECHIR